jgi:predicted PurR-regulated permease PerM
VRITIPRWAQFILIPVAIFLALYFARAASHAVFVFLMSTIVALLLNPVVLAAYRIKCPRWLAVPLVYLAFIAIVVLFFVFLGPPLIRQFQRLFEAIPGWLESLNGLLGDLEGWLASHNIDVHLQVDTGDIVSWFQSRGAESIGALVSVGRDVVGAFVNLFLTVVVSFYMLIDGTRIFRWALLFGFWAGITEVIPYVGPFLGAVPPVIAAFFHSPWAALIVAIAYFVIQQLESHILAPNIVGSSVGVHPLLVIFALLAGAQIGGILGMIASLPLLAMLKHTLAFYEFKFSRASWAGDDGVVLIPATAGPSPPRRSKLAGKKAEEEAAKGTEDEEKKAGEET